MSVVKDLKKARKLLRTVGFTQHQFVQLDPQTLEPVGYCALGAVNAAVYGRPGGAISDGQFEEGRGREVAAVQALQNNLVPIVDKLGYTVPNPSIPTFNDNTDFEAVDQLFTRAIKSAKKESTK